MWRLMYQVQHALPSNASLYKFLAAAYTVLLGLVLPFICWGTLATPGHPHRMAHLVFLMPPVRAEISTAKAETVAKTHQHQSGKHDVDQSLSATQPVGRSAPDQLSSAISIISPLFLVQVFLIFSPTHLILRLTRTITAHLFDPRVLTPPPRRLYL
jgi:hypothetical protein